VAQAHGTCVRSLHCDAAPSIKLSHADVHVAVCPPQDHRHVAVPVPEPTALGVDRVCSTHFATKVAVVRDNDAPGNQGLEKNVMVDLLTPVQTVNENQFILIQRPLASSSSDFDRTIHTLPLCCSETPGSDRFRRWPAAYPRHLGRRLETVRGTGALLRRRDGRLLRGF